MSVKVKWANLLQGVPTSEINNVVRLPRDRHEPPPVITTLYREIMAEREHVGDLEARRDRLEADLKIASDQARIIIGKVETEISKIRSDLLEKQNRWVMITRNLGIDIQDEPEGVE